MPIIFIRVYCLVWISLNESENDCFTFIVLSAMKTLNVTVATMNHAHARYSTKWNAIICVYMICANEYEYDYAWNVLHSQSNKILWLSEFAIAIYCLKWCTQFAHLLPYKFPGIEHQIKHSHGTKFTGEIVGGLQLHYK